MMQRVLITCAVLLGVTGTLHAQDETLVPTGATESANNDCTTGTAPGTLDEGVSGGGDYCTSTTCAANPTNDTSWTLTFDTPAENPSTDTNAQSFAATVKSCASGGTDPTCRLDLYCNGSLVESGSDQTISSSSGQDIGETFTFDDGSCDPTGADLELRVYCTASGGTPSGRRTGDLDAVVVAITYATAGGAPRRIIQFE